MTDYSWQYSVTRLEIKATQKGWQLLNLPVPYKEGNTQSAQGGIHTLNPIRK